MSNTWFQFKKFKINQDKTAMKVGVDSVLLGSVASFSKPNKILDIGAGTGLLSFMAEQRTHSEVITIEIDEQAYDQCLDNIILNHKEDKIFASHSSFQEFYRTTDLKFDHIICNPPFFLNSTKPNSKSGSIAKHTDSLSYEELIFGVSKLLSEIGIFSTIIPFEIYDKFIKIADANFLKIFNKIIVYPKELKNANRIILEFSLKKMKPFNDYICIREQHTNNYTKKYIELTKDFYLNLHN